MATPLPPPEVFSSLTHEQLRALAENPRQAQHWLLALEAMPSALRAVTEEYGRPTTEAFITEVLGEVPSPAALAKGIKVPWTPGQAEMFASFREHKRTAVHSGNGLGKSRAAAWITLAALHEMPDTIVITTAPTARHVQQVLWGEIRAMRERSKTPLPGRALLTSINISEGWYAMGYTARQRVGDQSATAFQGVHSKGRVVVVADEATDTVEQTWQAIFRITIGPRDRIFAIGNVTDQSAYFARLGEIKRPDGTPMWNLIVLSGEDHPNVVHDDAEIIPGAVTREFIEDMLHESGSRDSAVYRSAVLGLAPIDKQDGLISLADVTKAQALRAQILEGAEKLVPSRKGIALACDVAGTGSDLTIISIIEDGSWSIPKLSGGKRAWLQGRDAMEVAELIAVACKELIGVRVVVLDDTGLGAAVTARLRQLQREGKFPKYRTNDGKARDIWIVPKNFGASSNDPLFQCVKDQLWWGLREALREAKLILPTEHEMAQWELPQGNSLRAQLTTPLYFRQGGEDGQRIQVFDKKGSHGQAGAQITKHLPLKSPDMAHSCMMAWHGWSRLRADKADAKPMPTSLQELFDQKTREMMDTMTNATKRKTREKAAEQARGGRKAGPRSPWVRGGKR